MNRNVLACVLILAVAISSPAYADFTIATFNAEFLITDKVHVKFGLEFDMKKNSPAEQAEWANPAFREAKFQEAVQAVGAYLATLDADLLALTEVGKGDDITALINVLATNGVTYDHVAVCNCMDTFTKQHVAVLSKTPLFAQVLQIPGREGYYRELDDAETEDDTGVSKGLRVRFQIDNQDVFLYVVHLISESGGHEKDEQRIAQASIIRRHYVPLLAEGSHVIVTGDLNDHRGQPTLRRIRGFDDIGPDLMQTGHVDIFKQNQDTRWTYQFQGIRQQIDHILVSRSVRDIGKLVPSVAEQTDPFVSDHRPLLLTIEF